MKVEIENNNYSVEECKHLSKFRGLMFSKKRNLIFDLNNKREVIHGFFVFFPIQLYFLDESFKVLEKEILKPFRIYIPKVKAKYLVEIPC
ncbi:DUF192 domain-containing protein [Candidatus Woesearchaeota archaeon]|nr:DUF192 domain-containing protein [Candidatus Woesearchaeota archaeon]